MVHGGINIYRMKYDATRTVLVRVAFILKVVPGTDRKYQEEISC